MTTIVSKQAHRPLTAEEKARAEAQMQAIKNNIKVPPGGFPVPKDAIKLRERNKGESGADWNKYLDSVHAQNRAEGRYDDQDYQYDNSNIKFNIKNPVKGGEIKPRWLEGMGGGNMECGPLSKCANPGQYQQLHSAQIVAQSLNGLRGVGVKGLVGDAMSASQQSLMSRALNGPEIDPDEDLPTGPGFAYLSHLFKSQDASKKIKENQSNNITKGLGIMTNAMDGVRTALKMIGVAGDTNVDGLPIDMKDVMKIFHGDKYDKLDDIQRNEFMREIGDGTTKIDRKKIRKFVNLDGSLTWEILNDDKKSVMSRFTFGEYNGKKLFAQGGYKQFGELLREARQKLGADYRGEFDSIRGKYR